MVLRKRPTESH